ncbi:calponin homology domain-containing protein [Neocallimastix lanati (nom. inval.)]|jgi:parvin|uniref:Calponin-homology (CH) domain-containing protein n=1 Tax=Neocallimastix californiae TaxID=1754190 RepID=A0A1Y2AJ51_9FUNG|nr:calponin homology domain-containing protein [Neocallimastix sp. JGI-2020a]ORY22599.1 hypothetical protein LY90DRAFT_707101 [Neocallimastix californiae]|eukprot:ORY22599.1 hypothetical protein LY90DRAFT_707101 [Neocallimastix californiae]
MNLGVKENRTSPKKEFQLHASSKNDFNVKTIIKSLTAWVNQTLQKQHLVVRDLVYDMADGQILAAFIETITQDTIEDILPASTEKNKLANIKRCIQFVVEKFKMEPDPARWTAEGIVQKDIASILALLVDISHFSSCPFTIPSNVTIAIVHQDKIQSGVKNKTTLHNISGDESQYCSGKGLIDVGPDYDKNSAPEEDDVFDDMEANKEKIAEITELLIDFCNKYLQLMNVQVSKIEDFSSGVYIIWLIGLIKNIYIPTYNYVENPETLNQKRDNVSLGILLLEKLGINCSKIKPQDIAKGEIKSTLRCLYVLNSLEELDDNQPED